MAQRSTNDDERKATIRDIPENEVCEVVEYQVRSPFKVAKLKDEGSQFRKTEGKFKDIWKKVVDTGEAKV